MKGWETVRLGEVLSQRKEFIEIDDLQSYKRARVQLHAKGIILRDIVEGGEVKTKRQQLARTGEFLVAEIDAKVGGFGIVPEVLNGAIVSSHYFLFEVDERKLDRRFLDAFIKTREFRDQIEAQGSTNYAAIRPAHVLSYKIPLPPLAEQQRIVAIIESISSEIEEAKRLRQEAVDEAETMLKSTAAKIIDQIEESNNKISLSEVVKVRGGGTPSKANPLYWKGDIPWVSPKDMKTRVIEDSQDHISIEATRETSAKIVNSGAVLVVVRGMILAHTVPSAVLQNSATINQDMKALIPNSKLSPHFLCAVLWARNRELLELVEKSTHDTRKFRTESLLGFKIPLPPLPEQRRIVAELDALQSQIDSLKQLQSATADELDALLPSILDRAFRGEL